MKTYIHKVTGEYAFLEDFGLKDRKLEWVTCLVPKLYPPTHTIEDLKKYLLEHGHDIDFSDYELISCTVLRHDHKLRDDLFAIHSHIRNLANDKDSEVIYKEKDIFKLLGLKETFMEDFYDPKRYESK